MARRLIVRRIALDYLTDLVVSVSVVLVCGWLIQVSLNTGRLHDAVVWQDNIFEAINRFTPQHLFASYIQTISQTARGLGDGVDITSGIGSAGGQAISLVGHAAVTIGLAAPQTMYDLYQQTTGVAAWVVLAGFAVALCCVFLWLVTAGRVTVFRVVVASVLSPVVVSLVFLLLQIFMVGMLDAFFWFTILAPYAVACPVVCTLYWLVFPNANRGITYTLAHALGNALHPHQS
jgi:hypothetical protein